MKRTIWLAVAGCLIAALVLPSAAVAQDRYSLTASILGGIGGSVDEDQSGFGNSGFQLGLSLLTARKAHVGLRYGEIDYDPGDRINRLFDPTFTYVTVGGEYRFSERYYESGIFLGLGNYRLEGVDLAGNPVRDTNLGLGLGVTGEFELTRRFGFLIELTAHIPDFDVARYFATAHAGLAIHF